MCCRVATCCFIIDLRLATLIIAVLSLLGNIGVLAFTSWNIKMLRLMANSGGADAKNEKIALSYKVTLAVLAMILLMTIAAIFLDIVLFFGAFKRRRDMVQFWSYGHPVVIGIYFVYFWFVLVDCFASGFILYGFMFVGTVFLGALVTVYFWIVVRSYDLKMQRTYLRTVSASCDPSSTNKYVPAPSQLSAS